MGVRPRPPQDAGRSETGGARHASMNRAAGPCRAMPSLRHKRPHGVGAARKTRRPSKTLDCEWRGGRGLRCSCAYTHSPQASVSALVVHVKGHCGEDVQARTRGALGEPLPRSAAGHLEGHDARPRAAAKGSGHDPAVAAAPPLGVVLPRADAGQRRRQRAADGLRLHWAGRRGG